MAHEDDSLVAQMEELEMHQSPSSQPKLLFTRPRVYVATAMDNRGDIPGFLSLTEMTDKEYLLSWTPEAMIPDLDEEAYVDISSQGDHEMTSFIQPPRSPPLTRNRRSFQPSDYAVSVPVRQIYSILVYPPRMRDRFGSVIVNLAGGESLPAFMFLDDYSTSTKPKPQQSSQQGSVPPTGPPSWGGQELINQLEGLVDIVGSAIEPGVYLVNASHADKVNHGAATPPGSQSPEHHPLLLDNSGSHPDQQQQQHQQDQRLYPRLDAADGAEGESTTATLGNHSPKMTNTAFATATGAITREGMRRRRSINHHEGSTATAVEEGESGERGRLLASHQQGSTSTPRMSPITVSSTQQFGSSPHPRSRTPLPFEQHMDPLMSTVKEMRWNILERFSQVARFSRETATNILDHPLTKTILPPQVQQRIAESEAARRMMEDYDSARVYLAKWAAVVADQSDRERREHQEMERLHGSSGGAEGSSSSHHHHHHYGPGGHHRISDIEDEEGPLGAFNVLDLEMDGCNIHHTRTGPVTPMDWFSLLDEDGRLKVAESKVRELVFRGGIDHDIRIEVWKFFLGIYPWDSTEAERVAIRAAKAEEYFQLKSEWFEHPEYQATDAFQEQKLRVEKDVHRTDRTISFFASETLPNPAGDCTGAGSNENLELLKDILLTYNVWAAKPVAMRAPNKDGPTASVSQGGDGQDDGAGETDPRDNHLEGYVQGMSDLLAPVFAVMGDEVMGFWAFVGLMEKTKRNFYRDQVGMQSQLETLRKMIQILDPKLYKHLERCEALNLFCCFRWLLIWFKREFEWADIMRLWEVLFSDHLSTQFQLFVAMAILDKHRDAMMDHLEGFDEILKYINDLSMTINLEETLQTAEVLYRRLECIATKVDGAATVVTSSSGTAVVSSSGKAVSSSSASRVKELPPSIKELLTGPPLSECPDES